MVEQTCCDVQTKLSWAWPGEFGGMREGVDAFCVIYMDVSLY
jgi:hypothetical protein